MAHFYGVLQGARGKATRGGTKASRMHVTAASWEGAVSVVLSHDAETGTDMATVCLIPWSGHGTTKRLYHGPVSGND